MIDLVALPSGEVASAGGHGTLRRWRDGKPLGPPIATGQGAIGSLLERANGEVISGGSDGTLRRRSLPAVLRAACAEIDLTSIATDSGLDAVVEASQRTCQGVEAER